MRFMAGPSGGIGRRDAGSVEVQSLEAISRLVGRNAVDGWDGHYRFSLCGIAVGKARSQPALLTVRVVAAGNVSRLLPERMRFRAARRFSQTGNHDLLCWLYPASADIGDQSAAQGAAAP